MEIILFIILLMITKLGFITTLILITSIITTLALAYAVRDLYVDFKFRQLSAPRISRERAQRDFIASEFSQVQLRDLELSYTRKYMSLSQA
jgi:hypothetical protein